MLRVQPFSTNQCEHLLAVQDGVPACLQDLSQAGIKVWVLTGDKVETAISIAYSCNLFNNDMEVMEFREADFVRGKEAGWDRLKVRG
jgi:phospholipid-transporting ATPase